MRPTVVFEELWTFLTKRLGQIHSDLVMASEGPSPLVRHHVLDLYTASGCLMRAVEAFDDTLRDYIEHRELSGSAVDSIAELELISVLDFLAQAVETFATVCQQSHLPTQHDPEDVFQCYSVYIDSGGDRINRLGHALHFQTHSLDTYHDILNRATHHRDTLRTQVARLRSFIKRQFDFAGLY